MGHEQGRRGNAGGGPGRVARLFGLAGRKSSNPAGIQELIESYWGKDKEGYERDRDAFEDSVGGEISESYYTKDPKAGVILVDTRNRPVRWRHSYRMFLSYDSAAVPAPLEHVMRKARSEERKWRLVLEGKPQWIVVQATYGLIASVLNYVEGSKASSGQAARTEALAKSMETELREIRTIARESATRSTLQWYLTGMLPGLFIAWLVARNFASKQYMLGNVLVRDFLIPCVVCGAIGAAVSVMVRVSNNQRLTVEIGRGSLLSLVTGAFRPLIGGILAAAIYILVIGGIVPFVAPDGKDPAVFFAGLAFLAGFSERWAQDTIVSSTTRLGELRGKTEDGSPDPAPPATAEAGGTSHAATVSTGADVTVGAAGEERGAAGSRPPSLVEDGAYPARNGRRQTELTVRLRRPDRR